MPQRRPRFCPACLAGNPGADTRRLVAAGDVLLPAPRPATGQPVPALPARPARPRWPALSTGRACCGGPDGCGAPARHRQPARLPTSPQPGSTQAGRRPDARRRPRPAGTAASRRRRPRTRSPTSPSSPVHLAASGNPRPQGGMVHRRTSDAVTIPAAFTLIATTRRRAAGPTRSAGLAAAHTRRSGARPSRTWGRASPGAGRPRSPKPAPRNMTPTDRLRHATALARAPQLPGPVLPALPTPPSPAQPGSPIRYGPTGRCGSPAPAR